MSICFIGIFSGTLNTEEMSSAHFMDGYDVDSNVIAMQTEGCG